jgi:hypothetical protein
MPETDWTQDPKHQALVRYFEDLDRFSKSVFDSWVPRDAVILDLEEMAQAPWFVAAQRQCDGSLYNLDGRTAAPVTLQEPSNPGRPSNLLYDLSGGVRE